VSSIDIFVGTDRSQLLAVSVLEHSVKRHSRSSVRVSPLIDLNLPEPKDVRQGSRTNFSFARFAIPELKNYQGKAIYLDADMLVFRDIHELWSVPFDGAKVVIQEELPTEIVRRSKVGAPENRKKQCSVMLIDCERARWKAEDIIAGLDGQYTYEQLMSELCILGESEIRYGIPFAWNSLEHFDNTTRLIHYTDMNTQPWVSNHNKLGYLWMSEVNLMLKTGALALKDIELEIELGYFRPSLLRELRDMPHANGWDVEVAREYDEIDKSAGYVKHAEVYARKKARGEAIKQYEGQLKRESEFRAA
jgi:lipopolysaccharide biosynthesis glycosyltransferase